MTCRLSLLIINDDSCGLTCLIDSQSDHIIQDGKDKCTLFSEFEFFFPTSGVHTVPYFTGILRIQQDFF